MRLPRAWLVFLLWPIASLFLASCVEQTRQYKRSYTELDEGHYKNVAVMGGLPWCDEACQLRAKAANGVLLVESNSDPQLAFADLRSVVNDSLFAREIPPSQHQRIMDAYCLASYRVSKPTSAGQPGNGVVVSPEQVQQNCVKASEKVRSQVDVGLKSEYGQMITGLIQTGHLQEAKNAATAYTMLPTADRSQSAQWEQQIARSAPAAASTPTRQVWVLMRSGVDGASGRVRAGEPSPMILGVYQRAADCRRVRHQFSGQKPETALDPHADEASEGGLACVSSTDPMWGGRNPLDMWLLLMGEQWNKAQLSITCLKRNKLARSVSWGIYSDARSCDQARRELFGDLPCALCIPANDSDVVQ